MEKNEELIYMTDEKINDDLRRGNLRILPVKEGNGLRGIAASSGLTTEKMRTHKQED
ncbi:MAG: hypothetical protein LBN12_06545 [Clostridiales Family XIII bacterium]|jgi:hypothetical protein|nr:hypothetical protein [Clostridiales Family XIII bacterium]